MNLSEDLNNRFGHVASIVSRNTERKQPSASKLSNDSLQDVEKLTQNYNKLLDDLEKK